MTKSAFWVEWKGFIRDQEGNRVDPSSDGLRDFLSTVVAEFARHPDLVHPAVASHDGTLFLTSSVQAETDGGAVDKAQHAFYECVERARGVCNLPDGSHPSWSVYELERDKAEVRELTAA